MKSLVIGIIVTLSLLFPSIALSQPKPINPKTVEFNVTDEDYAAAVRFEIAYFAVGASVPVSGWISLGKPAMALSGCEVLSPCVRANLNTQPIPFGVDYVARVREVGMMGTQEVFSEVSEPSNPFDRMPGKPGGPVVK